MHANCSGRHAGVRNLIRLFIITALLFSAPASADDPPVGALDRAPATRPDLVDENIFTFIEQFGGSEILIEESLLGRTDPALANCTDQALEWTDQSGADQALETTQDEDCIVVAAEGAIAIAPKLPPSPFDVNGRRYRSGADAGNAAD